MYKYTCGKNGFICLKPSLLYCIINVNSINIACIFSKT